MKKNYDLSKIIKKEHEGKWIALSPTYDRVLDYSSDLIALTKKVDTEDVVYMKPTSSGSMFAF